MNSFQHKLQWGWRWTNDKRWQHSAKRFSLCWHLWHCLGVSKRLVFEVKKALKSGKKTHRLFGARPKTKETVYRCWKSFSLPLFRGIHCCPRGHCQLLIGAALPADVALDLCYISWLKLEVPAGQCECAHHYFPGRNISCAGAKGGLTAIFIAPILTLLLHRGR